MVNEKPNTLLKSIVLAASWLMLSPLFLILDGRWKLLPKWLRIVLFIASPMMLFVIVMVPISCYFQYWGYWYPRHHFVRPKVIENITGVRLPKYKVVEYEQGERYFNGDYSDSFTLEFKEMPNTDFYDELDKCFRQSDNAKISDSTVYRWSKIWGNGIEPPEGELESGDYEFSIRIERGSKTFHIDMIRW
jgi:hypothetical protein